MEYKDLDQCIAYQKLEKEGIKPSLSSVLDRRRIESYQVQSAEGFIYNYACKQINDDALSLLQDLSDEQSLIEQYQALAEGAVMNVGEERMVLHHLCRGRLGKSVFMAERNQREFYSVEQRRFSEFSDRVHEGKITGSTGKPFDTVVQIGIGGSDLGPRALYLALREYVRESGKREKMTARFISNVDPDDPNAVLAGIDPEQTLFILVTKSGTTQETLTNRSFAIEALERKGIPGLDAAKHMVAVTSESSPLAQSGDFLETFYIDDFIGGRYSGSSAVGGVVLSLAFGPSVFADFLEGAHEGDKAALERNVHKNAALLDALIGVYERNILGYPLTAVLPYSQALSRFPAHLQQLDMESNGKSVNRGNKPVSYPTGPVVFGEPGTNGQHSFYQLLHQGTTIVPLQFIGFDKSQTSFDINYDGSTSQTKLKANLASQITAFAKGKKDENPNKHFEGERPSSLLFAEQLNPRSLGALLSHFENKVMFQGFLWNINSFDQEGVQLGKVLTKQLLGEGEIDPILGAYAELMNIQRGPR